MSIDPEDRVLDRQPWQDTRSRSFSVSRGKPLPPVDVLSRMVRRWTPNPILDQGREGACTGFGVAGELGATPQKHPALDNAAARAIYRDAQRIDREAGRHYSEGATMLAAVKAAVNTGKASRYEWAFSYQELLYGILRRRPALFGITWLSGMYRPGPGGLLPISGNVVGGHCLYGFGYCPAHRSAFGVNTIALAQSWGTSHGEGGVVYARAEAWWELLQDQGETAFVINRRVPRS